MATEGTKKSMWKSWKTWLVIGIILVVVLMLAKRNSDMKAVEKQAGANATDAQKKTAVEALKAQGKIWGIWF